MQAPHTPRKLQKLLIANRGEIACRIIRTARRMGMATVAVYSDADAQAQHVKLADEAVALGGITALASYLRTDAIMAAIRQTGADAVHPGYGFLSENPEFAQSLAEAGVIFVGPPVEAIVAMGLKAESKRRMAEAAVPITPGYHGADQDPQLLQQEAERIGYPVMIKASAGGGGKGLRLVRSSGEFIAALESCQREAASSFKDATVLVERYIDMPRHIEIQVFADSHGNCVHVFERDCSAQRRHQKVIEEAPAPGMTAERRAAMGAAAVRAALAVAYVGAGTVEFIAAPNGDFYFMEMNTRLQVEHPVTEMITGLDLVEWQLRVARGEPLPLSQAQISKRGHAFEVRIYAEAPEHDFLPASGVLTHYQTPQTDRYVRVDSGVAQGDHITPFYDPMIAKLIVWDDAEDALQARENARQRMLRALHDFRIVGLTHNIHFLERLLNHADFAAGRVDTGMIARAGAELTSPRHAQLPLQALQIAALAEYLLQCASQNAGVASDPIWQADAWRMAVPPQYRYAFAGQPVTVTAHSATRFTVTVCAAAVQEQHSDTLTLRLAQPQSAPNPYRASTLELSLDLAGTTQHVQLIALGSERHIYTQNAFYLAHVDAVCRAEEDAAAASGFVAPMAGKVLAQVAAPGSVVAPGAPVIILEAMKMEHTLVAPFEGMVVEYFYSVGEQVSDGTELLRFEAVQPSADAATRRPEAESRPGIAL